MKNHRDEPSFLSRGRIAETAIPFVAPALDSAGGFALVLAGAKVWREHGIELNLVRDRHPDGL
jgi:hypothetical protein